MLTPSGLEGPRRLAAAGAARVLVVAAPLEPAPGVEVWAGPLATPLRLPLRDASVDAVLCIESYAALSPEDRAALIEEARRVLRPTGMLAIWSDDLPSAQALLQPSFSQVVALGQLRWSGVSLAPVGDVNAPSGGLRLVEDLLSAAPPAGPFLVLAGAGDLGAIVGECVLVATDEPPPATASHDEPANHEAPANHHEAADDQRPPSRPVFEAFAGSPEHEESPVPAPPPFGEAFGAGAAEVPTFEPALRDPPPLREAFMARTDEPAPVFQPRTPAALPVFQPVPPLGPIDESDVLAALFDPPAHPPRFEAPSATQVAEADVLREQVEALRRERDSLRERATTLTQELRHAHAQAIDAGAELHELRRLVEIQRASLEEAPTPMPELAGTDETAALTRVLVDEVAPIVSPEAPRPTADVVLDRDRLREELSRRTADLQELETRLWQSEEEVQRERLENVRLVTDVDRLREQVDRSRVVEHERMQELERLGHELRRLEVAYAELQGLYTTGDHRLRELEASIAREDDPPEIVDLEEQVRDLSAQRDQAQALERAANELARRRERELSDAARTIRELRRNVEEHASVAANLRGELAVMQVEVEQFGAAVPNLQERLREQQRKTLEREEESAELQRRLEEAIAEQTQLRQRLRRYKQELEAAIAAKDMIETDFDRIRGELDAKRRSVEQLQQLVALGAGSGLGTPDDDELQALRALLAQQASEHAERLAQMEHQQRQVLEQERERLTRVQLEVSIRGEEQEYLLYQLDTAEQRIWEMTDATDRSAARLAAGLAQLEKQKEQYEDLIDQLEVARTLLAEAQAQIVELERQLASDKAKLARLTLEPGVRVDIEDEENADNSGFDVLVVDRDEDSGMEIAPPIQRDPDRPDPLAGIDFDEDEESIAVRLATSFDITGAFSTANLRIDIDDDPDEPAVVLPSDMRVQIDLDDEDDDDVETTRPQPRPRRPQPRVLRSLPFLEDDDDMFSIDTDAIELATPTPSPPPPDRPGFDQKLTDHSNSRIVIEVLEDEAWPDEDDKP